MDLQEKGTLVAFEGMDGVGKSTAIHSVADALRAQGYDVLCLREPGGTEASERIRDILKSEVELDDRAEALLFAAARAQITAEVITPALAAGKVVLLDRYLHSSLAYQGVARGLGVEEVRAINLFALNGVAADRVLLLELSPDTAFARLAAREHIAVDNRFEQDAFQRRVAVAYDTLAEDPAERIVRVNADGTPEEVQERCLEALAGLFELT
jgi:dTMP kinase